MASAAGVSVPWCLLVIRREQRPIGVCVLAKRLRWTAELCHPLIKISVLIIAPEAEAEVWSAGDSLAARA